MCDLHPPGDYSNVALPFQPIQAVCTLCQILPQVRQIVEIISASSGNMHVDNVSLIFDRFINKALVPHLIFNDPSFSSRYQILRGM